MAVEVFVGGRPLSSMGAWGDLEVTHKWPLGSWELKWEMALAPYERPAPLTIPRADVYCAIGSYRIWAGNLIEPNWADSTFVAVGAARQGERAICLDGSGKTTTIPDAAFDQAVARGAVDWVRRNSVGSTAVGETEESDRFNRLAALLDAGAALDGRHWWIDAYREIHIDLDPTTPTAYLMPDNGVLGVAAEAQAGTVYGRYLDSATGLLDTVSYGSGPPEQGVDWTQRGAMSAAEATALCQGIWAPAQEGWTNPVTIQGGQLVTPGGLPMPLWRFRAGHMLRMLGVRDLRGLSANTDIVAAQTIWRPGDDTLRVDPVGMAARDIRSMAEDAGGVLLP